MVALFLVVVVNDSYAQDAILYNQSVTKVSDLRRQIRVRLASFTNRPQVSGRFFKVGLKGEERLVMQSSESGLSSFSKDQLQWRFTKNTQLTSPYLSFKGKGMSLNQVGAPEHFVLYKNKNRYHWVGYFDLENYIKGVLVKEMPASFPIEALKAQAIAARTYALKRMKMRADLFFDLESTVKDQVFQWPPVNHPQWVQDKIDRAVEETRGIVLLNKKSGRLIHAFYHADCGGSTESAFQVWNMGRPFSSRKLDFQCRDRRSNSWQVTLREDQLLARLRTQYFVPFKPKMPGESLQTNIYSFEVVESSPSGRARRVKFRFWNGHEIEMSGEGLRKLFGFNKIKSTLFSAQLRPGVLTLKGKGHGHGVGLCQRGARILAQRKFEASEILKHYYPFAQPSNSIGAKDRVALQRGSNSQRF